MENKCIHGGKFSSETGYPCDLYQWCDVMKNQKVCSDFEAIPEPEDGKNKEDDAFYLPVTGV